MRTELELTFFEGFYNSFLDSDIDNVIENELEYLGIEHDSADIKINYKGIASDYLGLFSDDLKKLPFIQNVAFSELVSPKYYNYSTDRLFYNCDFDLDGFKIWMRSVFNSMDVFEFSEYLSERINETHTSCSGFISFHSNNWLDWYCDIVKQHDLIDKDIVYKIGFIVSCFIEFENDSIDASEISTQLSEAGVFWENATVSELDID